MWSIIEQNLLTKLIFRNEHRYFSSLKHLGIDLTKISRYSTFPHQDTTSGNDVILCFSVLRRKSLFLDWNPLLVNVREGVIFARNSSVAFCGNTLHRSKGIFAEVGAQHDSLYVRITNNCFDVE